jgi:cytochrome P450
MEDDMSERKWTRDFHEDFDMDAREFNEHYGPIIEDLLTHCPVARSDAGDGYWLVSRYEDVRRVAQDWRTFSSEADGVLLEHLGERQINIPEESDPPRHDEWRKVLNPFFGPSYVARYEEAIRAIADDLIDQFVADGECDLVDAFSGPFPGLVFFKVVLGMPKEDLPMLRKTGFQAMQGEPEQRPAGWMALGRYVAEYLEERRDAPSRGDVVDAVLTAEFDGAPAPWNEKVSCVTTLVAGGLNTTTVVLTGAVDHMARSPEHREQVLADREAMDRAVEETLRIYNPAFAIGRTVMEDVEIGGRQISKGERVFVGYGAACRDPEKFENPSVFDLDRRENIHVAFGLGPHRCVGAHLVRLDLRVALTQLLTRLHNLRLIAEPLYTTSMLRELVSLRVGFDPAPDRTVA